MIGAYYNDHMISKARVIVAAARRLPTNQRDEFCQNFCGLTFEYLRRIGSLFKKPSARTLMNLGYELYVKDIATGELSRLELDVPCDWNPRNPRMNPASMPVSLSELEETFITRE